MNKIYLSAVLWFGQNIDSFSQAS